MFNLRSRTRTIEDDVTVIVRSVGERTEKTCLDLLSQQIDPANIHLIHEVPFSAALKRSYQIGLSEGRKWTLVVDADVLVRSGIIQDLYQQAEQEPRSVFVLNSEMIDKVFGGIRVGGMKMYRTKTLARALKLVPDVNIRPEGFVIKNMHAKGYYVDLVSEVCGLHDFEQYYADIYRKGFAHGIKHAKLAEVLIPYWKRMAKRDADFKVLMAGFELAGQHQGELKLAKDEVTKEFKQYLKKTGLKEKTKSMPKKNLSDIDTFLNSFTPPPEYSAVKQEIDNMGRPVIPKHARKIFR